MDTSLSYCWLLNDKVGSSDKTFSLLPNVGREVLGCKTPVLHGAEHL